MNWKTVIAIRQQGYAGVPPAAAASETLYPPQVRHLRTISKPQVRHLRTKRKQNYPLTSYHSPLTSKKASPLQKKLHPEKNVHADAIFHLFGSYIYKKGKTDGENNETTAGHEAGILALAHHGNAYGMHQGTGG